MFKNYVLVAYKVYLRRKLFTAINLLCISLTLIEPTLRLWLRLLIVVLVVASYAPTSTTATLWWLLAQRQFVVPLGVGVSGTLQEKRPIRGLGSRQLLIGLRILWRAPLNQGSQAGIEARSRANFPVAVLAHRLEQALRFTQRIGAEYCGAEVVDRL